MSLRFLQPLSWFLALVATVFVYINLSNTISGSSKGMLELLSSGLGSLFLTGSMLCTVFAPQNRNSYSPKKRKYFLAIFTVIFVLMSISTGLAVAGEQRKKARETARLEVERDMAKLKLELEQARTKLPTREEVNRIDARLKDIKVRLDRLHHHH